MALAATIDPGDEVIVEDPCFVSYEPLIRFCGGVAKPVPLEPECRFRWTAAQLEAAISEKTRAILFCSPHNPAGTVHTAEDLAVIAGAAQRRELVVIADETYERLTWNGRRHTSIATLPGMAERTISLFGLTKAFCMGGWRIGFALASPGTIAAMITLQQHMNTCVGSFVQTGAATALVDEPRPEVVALWRDWETRCVFATDALSRIPGIQCARPEGGFYGWIRLGSPGVSSVRVAEQLLERHHVALVPGAAFGAHSDGYLRMTCVRSWDELREGVAILERVLPELARA
jgi:aspartate/methionine/tyrosine aminotransferase